MHFGIFLEERLRGVSETATYRETLALADARPAAVSGLLGECCGGSLVRHVAYRTLSQPRVPDRR